MQTSSCKRWVGKTLLIVAVVGSLGSAATVEAQEDATLSAAHQRAEERLTAATEAESASLALLKHADYGEAKVRDPDLESPLDRARQLLTTARNALDEAAERGTEGAFRDAGVLASGARRGFDDFAARVRRQLKAIEAERAPPPPPPPVAPPPPVEPQPVSPPASAETPPATQDVPGTTPAATTSTGTTPALTTPTATPTEAPPPATQQAAPPPPPVRRASGEPPAWLHQAAGAFAGGDYQQTVDLLRETVLTRGGSRARAHGYLLRSAARYTLFILGGESDFSLRSTAIDDLLIARGLEPEVEPTEAFSPRFRDFYQSTE